MLVHMALAANRTFEIKPLTGAISTIKNLETKIKLMDKTIDDLIQKNEEMEERIAIMEEPAEDASGIDFPPELEEVNGP